MDDLKDLFKDLRKKRGEKFLKTIQELLNEKRYVGDMEPSLYEGFLVKLIILCFGKNKDSDILLMAFGLLDGYRNIHQVTKRREKYAKMTEFQNKPDSIRQDEEKLIEKLIIAYLDISDICSYLADARKYATLDESGVCPYIMPSYLSQEQEMDGGRERAGVFSVPFLNTVFINRPEYMEKIHQGFQDGWNIQTLSGFGGMGKTRLAQEYARLHSGMYSYICWINAENEKTMRESCEEFLDKMFGGIPGDDQNEPRRTFIYFFEHHTKWLIIYDNADYRSDSQYEVMRRYLPNCTDASQHVLITTRYSLTIDNAIPIAVGTFTDSEAVSCLINRSGVDDPAGACAVAERLGNHPLAIVYAAGSIRYGKSYENYLENLEAHGVRMFAQKDRSIRDYKRTVQGTFEIIWDDMKLEAENERNVIVEAAMDLVNYSAFMASDWIIPSIFRFGTDECAALPLAAVCTDDLDREHLIRKVCDYCLYEPEGDRLHIHKLLQEIIRERLGKDSRTYIVTLLRIYVSAVLTLSTNPFLQSDKGNFTILRVSTNIEPNYFELEKYKEFLSHNEIKMMEKQYVGYALAPIVTSGVKWPENIPLLDRICHFQMWHNGINRYIEHFMKNYMTRPDIHETILIFLSCYCIAYEYYSRIRSYFPFLGEYCLAGAYAGWVLLENRTKNTCQPAALDNKALFCEGTLWMSFYSLLDMMGKAPKRKCMELINRPFKKSRETFSFINDGGHEEMLLRSEGMEYFVDELEKEFEKIDDDDILGKKAAFRMFHRAASLCSSFPICWLAAWENV